MKRGRKKHTAPNPIQARMIELSDPSSPIKLTLNEIGIKVANEFGREDQFTREYVRQVLNKWAGGNNIHRPTIKAASIAMDYLSGGRPTVTALNTIKALGLQRRQHKATEKRERTMLHRSTDWIAGTPAWKLALQWGISENAALVFVVRCRKLRPDLFPLRNASA